MPILRGIRRERCGLRTPELVVLLALAAAAAPADVRGQPGQAPAGPRNMIQRGVTQLFRNPEPSPPDLIDRHAPLAGHDRLHNLEQARRLVHDRKWPAAIEILQYLIDLPSDSAVLQSAREGHGTIDPVRVARWIFTPAMAISGRLGGGAVSAVIGNLLAGALHTPPAAPTRSCRSLKRQAEIELHNLPEAGRRVYLSTYGPVAADRLATARGTHDFPKLCDVASHFWNTPAGESAADEVATLLMDSGDAVSAAAWMSQLEEDGAAVTRLPAWQAKATDVFRRVARERSASPAAVPVDAAARAPSEDREPPPAALAVEEWTGVLGGPLRSATAAGDRPLLLEAWSSPLAQRDDLQELLRDLQSTLIDEGYAPFPAAQPIAVGSRVAYRTLRGVEVHDAATGTLLWRNDEPSPLEEMWAWYTQPQIRASAGLFSDSDDPQAQPLCSILYRDAVHGFVTSDEARLFAIEQGLQLQPDLPEEPWDATVQELAQSHWNNSFNSIAAYDLVSGRRVWTSGGPPSDEPFAPPLTGIFFFGPPTPAGKELFAIGVHADEVNLYCLDAATGEPQWSQLIAQYDGPKIDEDSVRQMWACAPLVLRGTIICPTNAGWLTAVDRLRKRISWSARYSEVHVDDRYQPQYSLQALDSRWTPSAPILAGGRIVFTPPELPDETGATEAQVLVIDAITGRVDWRHPMDESISLAGVFGDQVVAIGRNQLVAWSLAQGGAVQWSAAYPPDHTPCGQGVASNGIYWMPFDEGSVIGFRLSDGEIEAELKNTGMRGRLGNLLLHRDQMLSIGASGAVAFWQQQPLENEIRRRLAEDPGDAKGRLLAAQLLAANEQWDAALSELTKAAPVSAGTGPVAAGRDRLEWDCLVAVVTENPRGRAPEWQRLQNLANDEGQRSLVRRLAIDRAIAQGDWFGAVDGCWRLIEADDGPPIVDGNLTITSHTWGAARLERVWREAPAEVRSVLDERIGQRLAAASAAERAPLDSVLSFHPRAWRISLELAREAVRARRFGEADLRLKHLLSQDDEHLSAEAGRELIRLWTNVGSLPDARRAAGELAKGPVRTFDDGQSANDWGGKWLQEHPAGEDPPINAAWNLSDASLTQSGIEYANVGQVAIGPSPDGADWFRQYWLAVDSDWGGLTSVREKDGVQDWMAPLADSSAFQGEPSAATWTEGALLAVCYRGILHVFSPIDHTELWTWTLPPRFARPTNYVPSFDQRFTVGALTASDHRASFANMIGLPRQGVLLRGFGRILVILGQREIVAFDALTGRQMWSRRGISPAALLMLDQGAACVSAQADKDLPAAFRLQDGSLLSSDHIAETLSRALALFGNRLLTSDSTFRLFDRRIRIAACDPRSGSAAWSLTFPAETKLGWGSPNEMVAIRPNGEVAAIDLTTGIRTELGALPRSALRNSPRIHTASDADRVFVAVENERDADFSSSSMMSVHADGEFTAFDRRTQRLAWSRPIHQLSLVVEQFDRMPVLLFTSFQIEQRQAGFSSLYLQSLTIEAYNKANGQRLATWKGSVSGGNPSQLVIDPARQRIDVQSYYSRYRLQFAGPAESTSSSQPAGAAR